MNPKHLKSGKVELDNQRIYERCIKVIRDYNIQPKNNEVSHGVYTAHLSNVDDLAPHTWEELEPLIDIIKTLYPECEISNSFFLLTPKNGSMSEHRHPNAKQAVFVYYAKHEQGHPSFQYEADGWNTVYTQTGDWLTFEKTLLHRVPENLVESDRLVITFNI
jgi:hypothetical protein